MTELKGHFIKINKKNEIVKAYSSDFESPDSKDICVDPNGGRHFHLDLIDQETGEFKLLWDGSQIIEADLTQEKRKVKRKKKLEALREARKAKLDEMDIMIKELVLDLRTDKAMVKGYRQALLELTEPYKTNPHFLDNLNVEQFAWPEKPTAPLSEET